MRGRIWLVIAAVAAGACAERREKPPPSAGVHAATGSGAASGPAPATGTATPSGPGAATGSIAAASPPPLGSKENPVKCDLPAGERAYLSRLKCADGSRPQFERTGSVGKGPDGHVLDGYEVRCGGKTATIYMDMYHPGYVEKGAVAGFKISAK